MKLFQPLGKVLYGIKVFGRIVSLENELREVLLSFLMEFDISVELHRPSSGTDFFTDRKNFI